MEWFIGDFNGKKGIRRILKSEMQKDMNGYNIKFKLCNWDEALYNFVEQE